MFFQNIGFPGLILILITTFVVFVFFLILSFVFVDRIFAFLKSAAGSIPLTVLGPSDVLSIYFMIAGLAAIGFTIPFALCQVWAFVAPALTNIMQHHQNVDDSGLFGVFMQPCMLFLYRVRIV